MSGLNPSMNSHDIIWSLKNKLGGRVKFMGVYSADEVSNMNFHNYSSDKPYIFIANTLPSNIYSLGHWIVYYVDTKIKQIYVFDSYGLDPRVYTQYFKRFFNNHPSFKIWYNIKRLQAEDSYVCGLYAVHATKTITNKGLNYFLQYIDRGWSFNNYRHNDRKIVRLTNIHTLPNYCHKTFCPHITFRECKNLYC